MARAFRTLPLARLAWVGALASLAVPFEAARAACSWVESVTGWNGSLAWSYQHQASWSVPPDTFQGQTRDQLSATFELDSLVPGLAQGVMEGTMATFGHLDITGIGLPGYTEDQASGPFDAYAPPPPQMQLSLDSFGCTYYFLYGPEFGADGTHSVKSGGHVNTTEGIVEPGDLSIPAATFPIPDQPGPLTFSGNVEALAESSPLGQLFYIPPGPAYNSAAYLGDAQLGTASVQWSFQPDGYQAPLNDTCAGAAALVGITQDTTFATTSASDPTPSCGNGDRSVWFLVQVDESGTASVDTTGSDYGTIVSVWPMAQPCGALTGEVACGAGEASWSTEPGTYRVQVERASGSGGGLVAVATVPEPSAGAWAAAGALLALARRNARQPAGGAAPRAARNRACRNSGAKSAPFGHVSVSSTTKRAR